MDDPADADYPYVLVLDRAAQSLHGMLMSQRVAGNDPQKAAEVFRRVVSGEGRGRSIALRLVGWATPNLALRVVKGGRQLALRDARDGRHLA